MLRSAFRLTTLILFFTILAFGFTASPGITAYLGSSAFAASPSDNTGQVELAVEDDLSEEELILVEQYPYKTTLFEYFSGEYPNFDKFLDEDSYSYLLDTGDDNLTLISELSPELVIYIGNLYQLFLIQSAAFVDRTVKASVQSSVISILKGEAASVAEPDSFGEEPPVASEDVARSVWFLDKLYTHALYSDLMRISKKELLRGDETGATAFFRGITSLAMRDSTKAVSELRAVERNSKLYPYARVAFAQALFDKGDLSGAETELKALIIGTEMEQELKEKVRMLLGQVYFEEDLFSEALLEFMNIPQTSPYYREAAIGTSWALIKNGTFISAVDMLKELKAEVPYSKLEWEAQVMLGYGYMQLELYDDALRLFKQLLGEVTDARMSLDRIRSDSSTPSRYLDFLFKDITETSVNTGVFSNTGVSSKTNVFSKSEDMYFTILKDDEISKVLLQEYVIILRLRKVILSRRSEIAERRLYLENLISGMQNLFSLVDMETRLIKTILTNIDRRVDPSIDPRDSINMLNRDFFKDVETGLYKLWVKLKDREINDNEKEVVRLLLYDVGESLDCVKSSLICTIVDMADSTELSSDKQGVLARIIDSLEAIALDIESVRNGELIAYERSIEDLRNMVVTKLNAAELGIEHLDVMDQRLRYFLDTEDIAMRRLFLTIARQQIKSRGKNFKDDLTDLRAHIITGLISSQKAVEENMADESVD